MPKKNKSQIPNYNFSLSSNQITDIITSNMITNMIEGTFYKASSVIGGIYISSTNTGTVIQSIDGQPITLQGNVVIDGQFATLDTVNVINTNGNVSNPAITFSDDLTSGFYLNSSNQTLGIISNGVESITVSNSKMKLNTQIQLVDGTVNNPSIRFSDTDSGIYNYQNDVYICHDGVNKLKVDTDISIFTTALIVGNGTSSSNVGLGFGSTLTGFQYDYKSNDALKYINLAIDGQEFYKFGKTELIPSTKDGITLGSSSSRFNGVYAKNYYTTSDANDKKNITNLSSIIDQTSGFMRALRPVLYNYNDVITNVEIPDQTQEPLNSCLITFSIENNLIPPEPIYPTIIETITVVDEVLHLGLIAQEVSCLLTNYGFDAYHISPVSYDEPSNTWSFNYQDLNIMNLQAIQLLIGNLNILANNVHTSFATVGSQLTNLATQMYGIGAQITNLNARLTGLTSNVNILSNNVSSNLTYIYGNLTTINNNYGNVVSNITTIFGEITNINNNYDNVISNITVIFSDITNINNNYENVSSNITTIFSDISNINNNYDYVISNIIYINDNYENVISNISYINDNYDLLDIRVSNLESLL